VVVIVGFSTVTSVPPVAAVYHLIVPELAVALKTTWPEPHTLAGLTLAEVTVGNGLTVAVTAVREADTQPSPLVASA